MWRVSGRVDSEVMRKWKAGVKGGIHTFPSKQKARRKMVVEKTPADAGTLKGREGSIPNEDSVMEQLARTRGFPSWGLEVREPSSITFTNWPVGPTTEFSLAVSESETSEARSWQRPRLAAREFSQEGVSS